jgi:hypothetical protein
MWKKYDGARQATDDNIVNYTWKNVAGILHKIPHFQFTSATTGGSYHAGMNCVVTHLLLKHQWTHSSCTTNEWIRMCLDVLKSCTQHSFTQSGKLWWIPACSFR